MRQLPLVSQQEELTEAPRASQKLLLSESLTEALAQAAGHKVVRSAGLYLDQLCDTGEHDRLQRCFSLRCAFRPMALECVYFLADLKEQTKMCCRQLERRAREAPRHVLGRLRGLVVRLPV